MEGRGGNLEEDSDEHHGESAFDKELILRVRGVVGEFVDGGGAGGAEHEGDSVEEECCCEGAQQEVFDSGFRAFAGLLAVTREDVGGDEKDFEFDEDYEEFGGNKEKTQANHTEDQEGVVLALVMAVLGE